MENQTNKFVASVKPPRDKSYIFLWDDNIKVLRSVNYSYGWHLILILLLLI
jgi:hypothetical protein